MIALPVSTSFTAISTDSSKRRSRRRPLVRATSPGVHVEYVELLGRSNFSFLQGASHAEEMVLQAQRLGYRGLALCDVNGLYGVVRGYQAIAHPSHFVNPVEMSAAASSFQFFCGAEMNLRDQSALALIPMHKDGYTRLCQLITASKRSSEKGFSNLDLDLIETHNEDLLALALPPWNLATLLRLRETFHDRLYLPVWKDYTWQSLELYRQALQLEQEHGFQLVATQRPFMHAPERKPLHDILTCIMHKTTLAQAKTRLISNSERHLKPLPELWRLWRDRPDLLSQTVRIAARIHFSLAELQYEYPHAACPPGIEADVHLLQLVERGLRWRFPEGVPNKVRETVKTELALIHELNYEHYFLTLWDVCQFAHQRGILHQGRGSAANSVVCYALGLTAVDPTRVNLVFERFLSRERGEPPDIDIDFESGRREEVIQYIYQKYGSEHAAMVCTVICYRTRLALRECAKVLGLPLVHLDAMIKYMGREGVSRLEQALDRAPEWGMDERSMRLLLQMTQSLKGFPRHLGIHSGGFLIAKRPITECVPVEKATIDQRYVIQWNKDDLTVLKMLKIDVLGLGMLTALQKCFELLRTKRGVDWNLSQIPADDDATYAMIQQADTIGTFQIESRAQMSLLPRLRPKCFYDLVIEVAIIRPGPIQGGMVHPFLRRRHGQEPVTYPHPDLVPILARTCGVPIFQEQIMQIASTVAGFTPGEADELRRIMSSSWKKAELMHGLRQRLINGMLNHNVARPYAEQIYQTIVGFASYGFPESHAASFALLTYASCYFKCHYPDLFTCSLLNAQPMGFYSPRALIMDAQRHGVKFRPLDVQCSIYDYQSEGGDVRVGFRAVHGLKRAHVDRLVQTRLTGGPFVDLSDLVRRSGLEKSALMRLAAAGAFNSLHLDPRQSLWKIQGLSVDQSSLFFARESSVEETGLPQESDWETLQREYQTHGYSLVRHPLGLLRPALEVWSKHERSKNAPGFVHSRELHQRVPHGRLVRVAGLLSLQQRPPTAKGFVFLTLEDETGLINVVVVPDIYQQYRLVLAHNPLLDIVGHVEKVDGVLNLKAKVIRALPLDRLLAKTHAMASTVTGPLGPADH